MSYKLSTQNLDRCSPYLEQLLSAKNDITWQTDRPQTFARQLYQALDTASRTNHKKFGKLTGKFRFRQRGDRVIAEKLDKSTPVLVSETEDVVMKFDSPMSLAEIIGSMLHHKPSEAVFTTPILSLDAYSILDKWCANFGYEYTKMPLTLKRVSTNAKQSSEEGSEIGEEPSGLDGEDTRGKLFVDAE